MDVTSVTKEDDVSKQLSTSQEGPFKRIILITRSSGVNDQSVVLGMLGLITQLLSLRASQEIPRAAMVPLINSGRFEDFADTISDEYRFSFSRV